MKTIFAAIGALALSVSAAYADGGDGGKAQREFYAVARGDYSLPPAERADLRSIEIDRALLRRDADRPVVRENAAEARQREFENFNR